MTDTNSTSEQINTPASKKRRAVVAEDEALIRMDIVETLREGGYDVVGEGANGEEGVALAREHKPDVVVMDIKMPVMDGISAAEQIAQERLAPVVLLTAFSQTELVERARDAGAMAYVVKPFTPADLLPAVEIAASRFIEIRALESEIADITDRMETRKKVERAKGLLMEKMKAQRARVFPLDPEDLDGPSPDHEGGCGGRHRADGWQVATASRKARTGSSGPRLSCI
ncbi:transcriptional regulator [Demequina litorisediminis]|uniref:Transcriptional regulator n=1 Tax=Demequina litorisediminis TaxID=1849022 RepID=A0ABQ6IJY0_9MICO|nr:transcriptional regulator [Demequina litorisediminis]